MTNIELRTIGKDVFTPSLINKNCNCPIESECNHKNYVSQNYQECAGYDFYNMKIELNKYLKIEEVKN
jgi:hypothetical protein